MDWLEQQSEVRPDSRRCLSGEFTTRNAGYACKKQAHAKHKRASRQLSRAPTCVSRSVSWQCWVSASTPRLSVHETFGENNEKCMKPSFRERTKPIGNLDPNAEVNCTIL